MPRPEKPESTPKKTLTLGTKIGRLYEKLADLDRKEAAELAASPQEIRAKYEAKRQDALAAAEPEVRRVVEGTRKAAANGAES